jgi:hypothetical protein
MLLLMDRRAVVLSLIILAVLCYEDTNLQGTIPSDASATTSRYPRYQPSYQQPNSAVPVPAPTPSPAPVAPQPTVYPSEQKLVYPITIGYVNTISNWYGDGIAGDIGVPGYGAPEHLYNNIFLAFWSCNNDRGVDVGLLWQKALDFFGTANTIGSSTSSIQVNLREKLHKAGKKIFVSAFGAT